MGHQHRGLLGADLAPPRTPSPSSGGRPLPLAALSFHFCLFSWMYLVQVERKPARSALMSPSSRCSSRDVCRHCELWGDTAGGLAAGQSHPCHPPTRQRAHAATSLIKWVPPARLSPTTSTQGGLCGKGKLRHGRSRRRM